MVKALADRLAEAFAGCTRLSASNGATARPNNMTLTLSTSHLQTDSARRRVFAAICRRFCLQTDPGLLIIDSDLGLSSAQGVAKSLLLSAAIPRTGVEK
jgi:hypothetical protein